MLNRLEATHMLMMVVVNFHINLQCFHNLYMDLQTLREENPVKLHSLFVGKFKFPRSLLVFILFSSSQNLRQASYSQQSST